MFRPALMSVLTGIVAANFESYSTLHWTEETREDGTKRFEAHHRVIEYGIAVMLSNVQDWLDETAPPLGK